MSGGLVLGLVDTSVSEIRRIAVLGPGLLGGSVALAVTKRLPECSVVLWGRNEERVDQIRRGGSVEATCDLAQAVSSAELVVLAVPVGAMGPLGKQVLKNGLLPAVCVTDVGSVKSSAHESIGRLVSDHGHSFIGSHPMAGSERSGFAAADPDLFAGAPCILTNDHNRPEEEVQRLATFWKDLGARTAVMKACEHDRLVARISHVPHILSAVCALIALQRPQDGDYAGQGLRDTSRVGGGDPRMWTEILLENREQIADPLRESASALHHLADLLDAEEEGGIMSLLEKGQRHRRLLDLEK